MSSKPPPLEDLPEATAHLHCLFCVCNKLNNRLQPAAHFFATLRQLMKVSRKLAQWSILGRNGSPFALCKGLPVAGPITGGLVIPPVGVPEGFTTPDLWDTCNRITRTGDLLKILNTWLSWLCSSVRTQQKGKYRMSLSILFLCHWWRYFPHTFLWRHLCMHLC